MFKSTKSNLKNRNLELLIFSMRQWGAFSPTAGFRSTRASDSSSIVPRRARYLSSVSEVRPTTRLRNMTTAGTMDVVSRRARFCSSSRYFSSTQNTPGTSDRPETDRLVLLESRIRMLEEQNRKGGQGSHEDERKARKENVMWTLQSLFFGVTVVGIFVNLAYTSVREDRQAHLSALKMAFATMENKRVRTLRRLLARQPVLGFFEGYTRLSERKLGGYTLPNDLDRIDAALALHQRIECPTRSAWVTIAGEQFAEALLPAHDDVREELLDALTKLSQFHRLTQSGLLNMDHLPAEMTIELEMLGGVGKFTPKSAADELFLAAVHDFVSRRRQTAPFYDLMEVISPGWTPIVWEQKHDDLLVELYNERQATPRSDYHRIAGVNDEAFA